MVRWRREGRREESGGRSGGVERLHVALDEKIYFVRGICVIN